TADSIAASYTWLERFSTVSSYAIGVLNYDDDTRAQALNRFEHNFSQQFRFLLLPMTTLIGDYRVGIADYETGGRDAFSQFFLAGVSQTIGPRLQGSLFAGAQLRSSDLEEEASFSPYASASLGFVAGEKTHLTWSAQYSTEESNVIESSGRTSFSTGLQLSYGITPRIGSSISAYYRHDENTLPDAIGFDPDQGFFIITRTFAEDALDLSLNFSYSITPRLSAGAGMHYTEVWSDFSTRPYTRARYSGGLTYSF
ncbi:MAG TPA: outer membrane beta-barrel protein, partial [Chthoniobacterales bacterium]